MANNVETLAFSPEQNLTRYLQSIRRYPMLSHEKEMRLAKQWINDKDTHALDQIISSHLRLAAKIALGYRGYGLPIAELISEGNIGMMHAIRRFDPDKGFRFATYAMWWIRASMQEYILRSWSLVKLGTTAGQKKLFFNLKKIKAEIKAFEDGDLHNDNVDKIANRLNVTKKEVVTMNRRLAGGDQSLNAPIRSDGDGDTELQDWLQSEELNQEEILSNNQTLNYRRNLLGNALNILSDRERFILVERRLKEMPTTLQGLSERFGISRERVRQIEVRAFEKLSKSVHKSILDVQLAI